MKTSTPSLLVLTALASVLAVAANAAPPPGRAQALGALPPRLGAMARERLADLDSNDDGKISLEEFLAQRLDRVDAMISHLDQNGDGLLSPEEMHPVPPAAARKPARPQAPRLSRAAPPVIDREALMACMKSNPDFDPPELPDPAAIESRFEQADSNGDGKLSLAELNASVTTRATAQFKRMDKDGDGYLTAADRKAAQADRAELARTLQSCVKGQK